MATPSSGSGVSTFFSWWGQELYGLLPGVQATADTAAARTIIAIEGDELRLVEAAAGKASAAAPRGAVSKGEMLAYLAGLARRSRSPATVGLRLPFSACFVRRVELPAIARRDFGRMLAMDLERSTPFKARDVLTAFDVDEKASAKGLLKVRHLIVKRKAIDGLKSEIEGLGLVVTRVDCTQESGTAALPVNFLVSDAADGPPARSSGAGSKVAAVLAAALALSAGYLYVDRHEQAFQAVQAETTRLKSRAQAQKDALVKSQSAFAEIANYQKLRSESVSKVAILEELTRILPDTAWVSDLKIDGATADISGLAVSAAAIVPILERSKVFVDATSTASLTFDSREDKERFAIRARIRNAAMATGEPQKPAETAR